MILARRSAVLEKDLNVSTGNVCFPTQQLQFTGARRLVLLERFDKNPLGRIPDPDHLVLALPGFLHLARHEAELPAAARLVLGKLEPLGETIRDGHGRLRPELEPLEVADEIV